MVADRDALRIYVAESALGLGKALEAARATRSTWAQAHPRVPARRARPGLDSCCW